MTRGVAGPCGGTVSEALAFAVAAKVPVLLWGTPGTGKSAVIRAIAQAEGLPCETVITSIREPSDFAGLPVVHDGEVRFAPPSWAKRLYREGRGLLFLDELSTAPPAVQAALLRVVLERTVGDLVLPDAVTVVAAANPPDQAAGGWDLSAPLANRLCHLDWDMTPAAISRGFTNGWPVPAVPVLPDWWQIAVPKARHSVGGFLAARPDLAVAPPPDPAAAGRSWPSPRTWEMAAVLLTAAGAAGASEQATAALIFGAVGQGAGAEFMFWQDGQDLPDPEAVLASPLTFKIPERTDRVHAALSAVVAAVESGNTRARRAAAWKVLDRAAEEGIDVAAAAALRLQKLSPPGEALPAEANGFRTVLRNAQRR